MFGLACEIDDLRLAAFALRYILEAVDRADDVSIAIHDCRDVNERDAARAVWSLNVDFPVRSRKHRCATHRSWALIVREQSAVGVKHSIRSAD